MSAKRSKHQFGPVAGIWPGHVLYQNNIPVVTIIIFIAVVATERDFDSLCLGKVLDTQWVLWYLVDMGCSGNEKAVLQAGPAGR